MMKDAKIDFFFSQLAQMGSLKCVKFLVSEQSSQINCLDNEKASPLHFAASRYLKFRSTKFELKITF